MSSFVDERKCMVTRYKRAGYIHSRNVEEAILAVPREHFMDPKYTEYAYHDQPFPIPGDGRQTISAPFLEIGTGSGYGAAIARELVGSGGLVVTVEINPETYQFARENLKKAGYDDVEVILGDGTLGYPELAPYDAVSITASTPDIPPPIYQQMASHSRLIAPVGNPGRYGQDLLLYERFGAESSKRKLMSVVYVPLIGKYGFPG